MLEYQELAKQRVDAIGEVYAQMGFISEEPSEEWKKGARQPVDYLLQEYGGDNIVPIAHTPTRSVEDTIAKIDSAVASGLFFQETAEGLEQVSRYLRDHGEGLYRPVQKGIAKGAIRGVLLGNEEIMTSATKPGVEPMGLLDVVAATAMAQYLQYPGVTDVLHCARTIEEFAIDKTAGYAQIASPPLQDGDARYFYSQPPTRPQSKGWLASLFPWW
ncbi:MAG: hypothetical protein Q4A37_00055 [Candidatus Saccharibacteria bacterium]|nr:hypothetical protein [Candidatus Saccharibacteria bacterium]